MTSLEPHTYHPILLLCLAVLYGATMKMADLLDEHNLSLFRWADLIFGILWGLFGSALIFFGTEPLASALLAMNLAFLFRMRIDYRNHAIAVCLIVFSFTLFRTLDTNVFLLFFLIFSVFGSIKDYLGDHSERRDVVYTLSELGWFYVIPPLVYSAITSQWEFTIVFTPYIIAYNLIRFYASKGNTL